MRSLLLTLPLLLTVACGGSSSGPGGPTLAPLDLTGEWQVVSTSVISGAPHRMIGEFRHDPILGNLKLVDAEHPPPYGPLVACFALHGDGNVKGGLVELVAYLYEQPGPSEYIGDAWLVGFVDPVNSNRMEGTYTVVSGLCIGDNGTWEAYRQ